jgi:hypothetical protein
LFALSTRLIELFSHPLRLGGVKGFYNDAKRQLVVEKRVFNKNAITKDKG